jgi:iron complex outermembrane receptor protein
MITRFTKKIFASILLSGCVLYTAHSQDTAIHSHYDGLSLKDLLNVKIVSASKKAELLFEAPLSASVITKEEIQRVGCTSIMEALRLAPGMIVREQSNGNYDIHLRGMDNVPPNSAFDVTSNTTTLVMIDNRPIYSYLKGGTFWETLPIDINDVEKIEIIRGPAAALYGPNAVNGVINIITRQTKKDGFHVVGNSQQGNHHTSINNASIGYQGNKWSMIASCNYQHRDRSQNSYFEFSRNMWLDRPSYFIDFTGDTVRNVDTRYPKPELAMNKYAGNLFLNYTPKEKINFNISGGLEHSLVQKVSTENELTPLSTAVSDSRYADLRVNFNGLVGQLSYRNGTQSTDYDPGNKYDFTTLDANLEYNYTSGKLSIKPGISYRNAVYDDTKYSDTIQKAGIFNAEGQIISKAASLRAEYKLLNNKLRLVGGISANQFNYPDTVYTSYEVAATYRINKENLVRIVYSQAPRSSTIFDTYVDQTVAYFPSGYKKFTRMALQGNKNLHLLTTRMFEVGYRAKISSKLNIDLELFDITGKNYSTLVQTASHRSIVGTDTLITRPLTPFNLPLQLLQKGITVSVNFSSKKLQLKPFITVQKTTMKNYAPYSNTPDAGMGPNNIYSAMGSKQTLKSTPTVFGGASVNYVPNAKWNFNANGYYYSSQTYYHLSNVLFNDGIRGIDHIEGKLILNANVSYEIINGLHLLINAKNLLNNKSREFFRTDRTPVMIFGGANFEL